MGFVTKRNGTFPHLGSYAWASRPSATTNAGKTFFATDVDSGVLLYSDGVKWRSPSNSPIVLAQTGIPMILPSSGSIGNNGALSGITALPTTYSGGCYMYFPANAIFVGSAAGLYYVVMSSTTAGTIYNDIYTSGVPTIPALPTPFVTTGPMAYVQTTGADITLLSITVPGGLIGRFGDITTEWLMQGTNNANAKLTKYIFGGSILGGSSQNITSVIGSWFSRRTINSGNEAINITGGASANTNGLAGIGVYSAINTANNTTLALSANLAVATDYIVNNTTKILVLPA